MAKTRTPIPTEISDAVLYAHAHTCCVCTEEGKRVQIHHLDADPSNNDAENLAVLCFDCHDRAHLEGGFARRLSSSSIAHYRDEWLARVERRRDLADEIRVAKAVAAQLPTEPEVAAGASWEAPASAILRAYIDHLPGALAAAYEAEREEFDSGVTARMVQVNARIADAVEQMWLYLAKWFPPGHFGKDHAQYISDYRGERAVFHWSTAHVGEGPHGTMMRVIVAAEIVASLEDFVKETVFALTRFDFDFDGTRWVTRWEKAAGRAPKSFWKSLLARLRGLLPRT